MERKSKIKKITVHKVPDGNYNAKLSELAKIHADIIKRRINELNAAPEVKILIINNIIEKLRTC
jgi:hypothetical protein